MVTLTLADFHPPELERQKALLAVFVGNVMVALPLVVNETFAGDVIPVTSTTPAYLTTRVVDALPCPWVLLTTVQPEPTLGAVVFLVQEIVTTTSLIDRGPLLRTRKSRTYALSPVSFGAVVGGMYAVVSDDLIRSKLKAEGAAEMVPEELTAVATLDADATPARSPPP